MEFLQWLHQLMQKLAKVLAQNWAPGAEARGRASADLIYIGLSKRYTA
jgi:hypothetical protein